jgi:hypothetical protein
MATSRLDLNFNIENNEDRVAFLDAYLPTLTFTPTDEELEIIANYVLWGKDPKTGFNAKQEGLIDLESRNKTWDKSQIQKHESLEMLMDTVGFNEAVLTPLTQTHYKTTPEKFSRERTLRFCPEEMRENFLDLFKRIDTLALRLNFWEIAHDKRT